jgi:hypothetical protein|nr:MAG TPA: hemolysin XhlA [Caudoviricetes sp.]
MAEQEYHEIHERLIRIETQLETIRRDHPFLKTELYSVGKQLHSLTESIASAHKRIDEFRSDICFAIGASTTIVGIFASLLTWALGGR